MIEDVEKGEREGNISLTIKNIGTWVFKLRNQGNIFNRRDLILWETVKIDTQFIFQDMTSFHYAMIGGIEDEILHKHIEIYGSAEISKIFRKKCSKLALPIEEIGASAIPVRENRIISPDSEQPIKAGWLLKKRDILNGWKCRYFEVFRSNCRFDYYSDQQDAQPRHSVSLLHADISEIKTFKIKKMNAYFGIIIETKNPDKTFRLASERMGLDGKAEMEGWRQALVLASNVGYPGDFQANYQMSTPMTSNPMRAKQQQTTLNSADGSSAVATSNAGKSSSTTPTKREIAEKSVGEKSPLFSRRFSFREGVRGNDHSSSITSIIFYGAVLLSLAILLQYWYFVYATISWTTYLTGNSFVVVLFAIYLQEYVFDDSVTTATPINSTAQWQNLQKLQKQTKPTATDSGGVATSEKISAITTKSNVDGSTNNAADAETSKLDNGDYDQVLIDNNHFPPNSNLAPSQPGKSVPLNNTLPQSPPPPPVSLSPKFSPKTSRSSLLKLRK